MAPLASPARAGRVDATKADGTGGAGRRSTVPSTDGDPRFIGRDAQLDAIERKLRSVRVVIVHGPPGLGKSRLAMEYAHRHADTYPGGTLFVRFDQPPPTDLAKLLRDLGKPAYPEEPIEDQCRRALAAKERGDVYGRVDPDHLGKSLHGVGDCHANLGRFAEALSWLERAVAEKQKGDMHGRVDLASLAASVAATARCHAVLREMAEASSSHIASGRDP